LLEPEINNNFGYYAVPTTQLLCVYDGFIMLYIMIKSNYAPLSNLHLQKRYQSGTL